MTQFKTSIITAKGHALMAKLLNNQGTAKFTKVVTSDTVYKDEQLEALTAISAIKQSVVVSNVTVTNSSTVTVEAAIENSKLTQGYYLNTIGLYAQDPTAGEILYSVTTAEQNAFIPAFNSVTSTGLIVKLITSVSNSENVSLEINPAATMTREDTVTLISEMMPVKSVNGVTPDENGNAILTSTGRNLIADSLFDLVNMTASNGQIVSSLDSSNAPFDGSGHVLKIAANPLHLVKDVYAAVHLRTPIKLQSGKPFTLSYWELRHGLAINYANDFIFDGSNPINELSFGQHEENAIADTWYQKQISGVMTSDRVVDVFRFGFQNDDTNPDPDAYVLTYGLQLENGLVVHDHNLLSVTDVGGQVPDGNGSVTPTVGGRNYWVEEDLIGAWTDFTTGKLNYNATDKTIVIKQIPTGAKKIIVSNFAYAGGTTVVAFFDTDGALIRAEKLVLNNNYSGVTGIPDGAVSINVSVYLPKAESIVVQFGDLPTSYQFPISEKPEEKFVLKTDYQNLSSTVSELKTQIEAIKGGTTE